MPTLSDMPKVYSKEILKIRSQQTESAARASRRLSLSKEMMLVDQILYRMAQGKETESLVGRKEAKRPFQYFH